MGMAKKDRWTKIIEAIVESSEGVTARDLVLKLNNKIPLRTIQRDLKELCEFPYYEKIINVENLNRPYIYTRANYDIEHPLSDGEKTVLDTLEKVAENMGGEVYTQANSLFNKIRNKKSINPFYTRVDMEDISDKLDVVTTIENAMQKKKKLEFTYKNGKKEKIQPLKIANYEGFWYLVALNNNKLIKYYLKEIQNISITDIPFNIDTELQDRLNNALNIWFDKDVEPFEVRLFAKNPIAKYFMLKPLPTQYIEKNTIQNNDGGLEFSVKITDIRELLPIIKYWLPNLFVVVPESTSEVATEIREMLVATEIKRMLKEDLCSYIKEMDKYKDDL